jgi:hypothetical protein
MKVGKLQLVFLRDKWMSCIPHAHYDLCTLEKEPKNIGCILTDKDGAKLIRKWIKEHNKGIK